MRREERLSPRHPKPIAPESCELPSAASMGASTPPRSSAPSCLSADAFGCLGVGVPYAVAASLAFPDRQAIAANGDGAYGRDAMEIDIAFPHGAKPVIIVSNNAARNVERQPLTADDAERRRRGLA